MQNSVGKIICAKCLSRSIPIVARLIDEFRLQFIDQQVLEDACAHGAAEYDLDFILLRTTPNWKKIVNSVVKRGHLHVLEWMVNRRDGRGPWFSDFKVNGESCLNVAASHGQLETMKWLFKQRLVNERDMDLAAHAAASNGNVMIMKWLHKHTKLVSTITGAARNGHLEMAQWIFANLNTDTTYSMVIAAGNGRLDVLQWLHQRRCCSDACTASMMDDAVEGEHFHVVKWLYENCGKGCTHRAAKVAAWNGDLKMLQWLHAHFTDKFTSDAMDEAARYGHLDVVKWLHKNRTEGCSTNAMDAAAAGGYLDVVQWLHENRDEGCTKFAANRAASNGHLSVAEWILNNHPEGYTRPYMYLCLSIVEGGMIRQSVRNGHMEVVRWLVERKMDIFPMDLMEDAVWQGHLEIACYLGENTKQRASDWGLIAAAKQGYLSAVFVLIYNTYPRGISHNVAGSLRRCILAILSQLSDQRATPASPLWREVIEVTGRFHTNGLYVYASFILDHVLQHGFLLMVHQFFKHKTEQIKREYVSIAARENNIMLLRWLVEHGTPLDVESAFIIASKDFVELTWWLSEEDRVTLVCKALQEERYSMLKWVLENTIFNEESSHHANRSAIGEASREIVKRLSEDPSSSIAFYLSE